MENLIPLATGVFVKESNTISYNSAEELMRGVLEKNNLENKEYKAYKLIKAQSVGMEAIRKKYNNNVFAVKIIPIDCLVLIHGSNVEHRVKMFPNTTASKLFEFIRNNYHKECFKIMLNNEKIVESSFLNPEMLFGTFIVYFDFEVNVRLRYGSNSKAMHFIIPHDSHYSDILSLSIQGDDELNQYDFRIYHSRERKPSDFFDSSSTTPILLRSDSKKEIFLTTEITLNHGDRKVPIQAPNQISGFDLKSLIEKEIKDNSFISYLTKDSNGEQFHQICDYHQYKSVKELPFFNIRIITFKKEVLTMALLKFFKFELLKNSVEFWENVRFFNQNFSLSTELSIFFPLVFEKSARTYDIAREIKTYSISGNALIESFHELIPFIPSSDYIVLFELLVKERGDIYKALEKFKKQEKVFLFFK